MAIAWNPAMTTGLPSIDEQHKELFRQVAALNDAMLQGKGREEIRQLLDFLGSYVAKHFAEEERAMEQYACPEASANRAAHAAFLAKFQAIRARFDQAGAGPSLVIETYDTATKWLVDHIRGIDCKLLASVRRRDPACAAQAK